MTDPSSADAVREFLAANGERLVAVRRDLHAHPELGHAEVRTTARVADALRHAGLDPRVLPGGTGLVCDVGEGTPTVALRADLDALPLPDTKQVPYRSQTPGVAHACGHDVHTTVVLGTGLFLAREAKAGRLPRAVRLVFQPAEETIPGGAHDVIAAHGLAGVERIYATHCDPSLDVGMVGLRAGSITAASDHVEITVSGPGGHTARPHLTVDLVTALAAVAVDVPAVLARRVDPRDGVTLVWGAVNAGSAMNVIPREGRLAGTIRTLDRETWSSLPPLVEQVVRDIAGAYGADAKVEVIRGVPPVVNDPEAIEALRTAATRALGPDAVALAEQSLGGEDFAWYLDAVPGALVRLGTRSQGSAVTRDLHQPDFDVDERAIAVGIRLFGELLTG